MNFLAHFCFNYIIIHAFYPEVNEYMLSLFLFSIIIDADHIPGYLNKLRNMVGQQVYVPDRKRSWIQEPFGILILSGITLWFTLIVKNPIPLYIGTVTYFLHFILDAFTVRISPISPFKEKVITLFFHSKTARRWADLLLTIPLLIIFLFEITSVFR